MRDFGNPNLQTQKIYIDDKKFHITYSYTNF